MWVGTSLSDQHLDKSVLEKQTNTRVDKLKTFTITRDEGRKNKYLNAEDLVSKALENNEYNVLVLELGVNEVSNPNIQAEKHVLREHMRKHMEKLFHLSLQFATDHPNLKVVLLNLLPRLDSVIRADISRLANQDMAKLWEENSPPDNIVIESLNLQVDSRKEKEEVFGRHLGTKSYGIHLRGVDGNKEFSYRAARLLCRVLGKEQEEKKGMTGAEKISEERSRIKERKLRESKRQYQIKKDEERRITEEKNRRQAEIKKREDESRARLRESRRKEDLRKENEKRKLENMRRSDREQQRKMILGGG